MTLQEVDELVVKFQFVLMEILRSCTQLTRLIRNNRKPLTKSTLKLINKKRKAWHKYQDSSDSEPYRLACAIVKSAIKNFHLQQEYNLLSQHISICLFKYVNSSLGNKNSHPIEITLSDGSKSNDSTAMLHAFSDEFSCNFNALVTPSSYPAGNAEGSHFFSNVEECEENPCYYPGHSSR